FVDAVRPESELLRSMQRAAAAGQWAALRGHFALWSENHARFQAMAEGNAMLTELLPLSKDLATLGGIGLKTVQYLSGSTPAPADWLAAQTQELARIRRPQAEVMLAAFQPVKMMLDELSRRAK